MKLLIICALVTVAIAAPGLLRIPKVYNAVITSNQNLSPSRAFPVIQPVIHRTAVGYVPPFYYTQVASRFTGPGVAHYQPQAIDRKPTGNDQAQASPSQLVESTSFGISSKEHKSSVTDSTKENANDDSKKSSKKNGNDQISLSFYPNYHSLYYNPYIYTYNGFNPHLVPGTYYIEYQPYGSLEPIPATTPKNVDGHLLPSFRDEKRERTKDEKQELPDIPPSPFPTSAPKKS